MDNDRFMYIMFAIRKRKPVTKKNHFMSGNIHWSQMNNQRHLKIDQKLYVCEYRIHTSTKITLYKCTQ